MPVAVPVPVAPGRGGGRARARLSVHSLNGDSETLSLLRHLIARAHARQYHACSWPGHPTHRTSACHRLLPARIGNVRSMLLSPPHVHACNMAVGGAAYRVPPRPFLIVRAGQQLVIADAAERLNVCARRDNISAGTDDLPLNWLPPPSLPRESSQRSSRSHRACVRCTACAAFAAARGNASARESNATTADPT